MDLTRSDPSPRLSPGGAAGPDRLRALTVEHRNDAYAPTKGFVWLIPLPSLEESLWTTFMEAVVFVSALANVLSRDRRAVVARRLVTCARGVRRPSARSCPRSRNQLTKLGAVALAFVFAIQFVTVCLCGPLNPTSTDPHACCPEKISSPGGSSTTYGGPSLASHARRCCLELDSRALAELSPRVSLPERHLPAISSASSSAALIDQTPALGSATAAAGRPSFPPRSFILRI